MKSVKSILGVTTLALALAAGFNTALAEGPMDKGNGDPSQRHEKLKEKLNLTDEQSDHVKKVLDDAKIEMDKLKMQMDELKVKVDDDILSVLDEEQKAKFNDMKAKRESKRMNRMSE